MIAVPGSILVIRPTGGDAVLLDRVNKAGRTALSVPHRIVLDAHTAAKHPEFARSAQHSGVPVLIDPLTHYLQDVQHPLDPWALLPFGHASRVTPADFTPGYRHRLVAASVEYQIAAGATRIIAPYIHIERSDNGWLDVQLALYRRTRALLDQHGIELELTCVVALGWRLLNRTTWSAVLDQLLSVAAEAGAAEVALAGSRVDQGVRPGQRLADLLATVARCTEVAPVIAWNQGVLGEACVAAGAAGYETGIGWRERCDLPTRMREHRAPPPPPGTPQTGRPIYVDQLRRSVTRKTITVLAGYRSIAADLPCRATSGCCRTGVADLIADSRFHTIVARARTLDELHSTDPRWRWSHLATVADAGLDLAERMNTVAARVDLHQVNTAALTALSSCASDRRRHRHRPSRAA